ncbi:MAG TPA: fasciclin domain-containing protein [Conexibacter sp.]|nr:fasciclin domain-containing protein [Conexibacter sp.]
MKRIAIAVACLAAAAIPVASVQAATPQKNLVETAAGAPQFSTLVSLVKKAGLVSILSGRQNYTVFAPTNAAFSKVPRRTLNALANDRAKLKAVLLYHVVKGKVPASKVVKLDSAKTVNGASVTIDVRRGKVYVNDARVTKADIKASNGIVHQINRVLLPPS